MRAQGRHTGSGIPTPLLPSFRTCPSSFAALQAMRLPVFWAMPSRSSPTGQFGSRLVTAVLSGTEEGGVDVQAYQVSEQACAMVDADMIEASVKPGIVWVKEEDRDADTARYVPDVFFRYKNGLQVKKSAKPCFPVEYLIINVCTSLYTFHRHSQWTTSPGHT
jgi:nuclear protein localization family protein 4